MIGIVGIGCRFPGGVSNSEEFWELLCSQDPAISSLPVNRGWNSAEFVRDGSGGPGMSVTDRAGWLSNLDGFDPQVFQISPKEACEMDPQQRLVLEVTMEALLDAYINPASLAGSNTGVFVGAGIAEYMAMAFGDPDGMTQHTMAGNSLAVIANRVSYTWDLRGPSLTTDTACSSALTAFHLACNELERGTCDTAIVAGVNVMLGPSPFVGFTQAQMLSPSGQSRPFDAGANGFVRGEGCGVVVLRRTSPNRAPIAGPLLPDSRVYAWVRGHGANEDGRTKSLTMPSEESQTTLMADVIRNSQTEPEDIVYVEAHGTGTKVGDPIEARSISTSTVATRTEALAIGSAKGHVGHLETAAGIVGVIKCALILHKNQIPPTASFTAMNPSIDSHALRLRVVSALEPLPVTASGRPPLVSVNSYGFGGSNAFAILEQSDVVQSEGNESKLPTVLSLSSHFQDGVARLEDKWRAREGQTLTGDAAIWSVCQPAGRYRKVLLGSDADPNSLAKAQTFSGDHVGVAPACLFAFGGQGSHYPAMGCELYAAFTPFRNAIDEAVKLHKNITGVDLSTQCGFCIREMSEGDLGKVAVSLPCIVYVQVALIAVMKACGVVPTAVLGHSTGEMVAAYSAGALSLPDLVAVTAARATAQERMQEGRMAAFAISPKAASDLITELGVAGRVSVACLNTVSDVTIAGDTEAVERVVTAGKERGLRCTLLNIPRAYHSPHVDAVTDTFLSETAAVESRRPEIALFSSTLGVLHDSPTPGEFWARNMRDAVKFSQACEAANTSTCSIAVELSPHAVLMPYIASNLPSLSYIPALNRKRPAVRMLLTCLAQLHTAGVDVDWRGVLDASLPTALPAKLPSVEWRHKDVFRSKTWRNPQHHSQTHAPLADANTQIADSRSPVRATGDGANVTFHPDTHGFLSHHIVDGEVILPGAAYVATALHHNPVLTDIEFHRYLALWSLSDPTQAVTLSVNKDGPRLTMLTESQGSSTQHFVCVLPKFAPSTPDPLYSESREELEGLFQNAPPVNLTLAYRSLAAYSGLQFGPSFRSLEKLQIHDCKALAVISPLPSDVSPGYPLHPITLDACFQALAFVRGLDSDNFVPAAIASVHMRARVPCSGKMVAYAVVTSFARDELTGDVDLYSEADTQHPVATIRGLLLKRAPSTKSVTPNVYKMHYQGLGFMPTHAPPSPIPELAVAISEKLAKGDVVSVIGLSGSDSALLALTQGLKGDRSNLVVATVDSPPEGVTATVVDLERDLERVKGMWDVIVMGCGSATVSEESVQWLAAVDAVVCREASWSSVLRKVVPTRHLCVFGSPDEVTAFTNATTEPPQAELSEDTQYILDCRNDITKASELLKLVLESKTAASLVLVIPESSNPSPLWGFARAARNETGVRVIALGVPSSGWMSNKSVVEGILALLSAEPRDLELAYREGQGWHVPRLMSVNTLRGSGGGESEDVKDVRLQVGRPGQLSTLHWHPLYPDREGVRAGEVRVRVHAVSLHFKDVMLALGMLSDFKPILGMECSGVVTEVGPEAGSESSFKVGDRVMCLAMSTDSGEERSALFGTTAVVRSDQVVKMPEHTTFTDAAGFLGVMATAWHALVGVAQLTGEDTVLVHSALGGVGQAALQIAKLVGAKVIASAGSEKKRAVLREMGIEHVMDSHNPAEFVSSVRRFTNGRGVDVVLNSLAGDGQVESLKCVAPAGRFVEIGKRDILTNTRLGLRPLKENVSFFSVHLDLLDKSHPQRVRRLLHAVAAKLATNELHPLPSTVFPAERAVDAFRLMASGEHRGKLVVEFPTSFAPSTESRLPQTLFPHSHTVVVSGGSRGLGLETARWAVEKGARSVVLLSSTGNVPRESELVIENLHQKYPGIAVTVETVDVRDPEACVQLFKRCPSPVCAIFHAANQYSAGDSTTVTALNDTYRIKVDGAQNLCNAAAVTHSPVMSIVLFTSLAGLHGNKGQALYVSANAALQRLAGQWRVAATPLPVVSVDFPIVVGGGRLKDVRNVAELELNTGRGFGVVSFSRIEPLLAEVVSQGSHCPSHVTFDAPEWRAYCDLNRNAMMFAHNSPQSCIARPQLVPGSGDQCETAITQSPDEIQQAVLEKIAFVLGAGTEDVEMDVPLPEMGVDSLAAVELANWAQSTYRVTVSQTEFLSGLTPQGFLEKILKSASGPAPTTTPRSSAPQAATGTVDHANPSPSEQHSEPKQSRARSRVATEGSTQLTTSSSATGHTVSVGSFGEHVLTVPEKLNPSSLRALVDAVKSAQSRVLLIRGTGGRFCLGMDLEAATFADEQMSVGLEMFAELMGALESAKMPVVCVCEGATRGGGMLFPSMATVAIASENATFGFPEIRQGGLPGVVSVAAQRRMSLAVCQRLMCLGDEFSAAEALRHGFVDFVGDSEGVEREIKRVLGRFRVVNPELLSTCKERCPAPTVELALLTMGSLDKRERVRERAPDALVNVSVDANTGVAVLELNDPTHCNAMDWAISDDLRRAVESLKARDDVRAVVFQGKGDHFCVGVNPYNFIRRVKKLPVITSAQITYEIYRAFVGLRDIGCPVIAAVHGKVVGGGLAACLNADYRIAHAETVFNYGNLPRGVCPGLLLSENLPRIVGGNSATDLYMNDITVSAAEAKQFGLINEIYPTVEATQQAAYQMALRLASYPPMGVRATLSLMRPAIDEQRLARESIGIARCNIVGNAFTGAWKAPERRVDSVGQHIEQASTQRVAVMARDSAVAHSPSAALAGKGAVEVEPIPNSWTDSAMYLERYTSVLPDIPDQHRAFTIPTASITRAFLTGSTGFLGAFILRDLLERGVAVICLARAKSNVTPMSRIVGNLTEYGLWKPHYSALITAYRGNLADTHFGLSPSEWAEATACQLLIHNGANVNFACSLDELLRENVGGTLTAVTLAVEGTMRLVHVSSLSVFSLYRFVGDAATHTPDPSILINGYARSKWLAEQVVWAAGAKGLAVTVLRPGRIMGDSQSGAANLKDWFARYLITCVRQGITWDLDHGTDMTQVDAVSELTVHAGLDGFEHGKCLHAVSLAEMRTHEITQQLLRKGYQIRAVPYTQWMEEVRAVAAKSAMAPLIDTFDALPIKETSGQNLKFSSDMPHRNGDATAQLNRMLDWMITLGFLPKPPSTPPPSTAIPQTADVASLIPPPRSRSSSPRAHNGSSWSIVDTPGPQNVGIRAMELYTPNHTISQAVMERHHGCEGKYTTGLLQEAIGFCGDDEDAASMALTVTQRLLERTGVSLGDIGRVEVGTESLLDRSKSIKTHIMALFQQHGHTNIEGVDNYNACYGGTAALLNSLAWVQSSAWDGRLAIVVCVDIADLNAEQSFLNGASAVAMLVGPDAALVMESERASCMINTWDFYKPVGWRDSFPLMRDGKHSIDCYMKCLDKCYSGLRSKVYHTPEGPATEDTNLVSDHDYFVFHCTSTYLCKRAFKRMCENAFPSGLKLREQQSMFARSVEPSCLITKQVGSSYTASCYTNLYSLLVHVNEALVGKRVVLFSYGSGSASTMYRLRVRELPVFDRTTPARLAQRVSHTPEEYLAMLEAYSASTYGRVGFRPREWGGRQEGVFYLTRVDEWGKRFYGQCKDGRVSEMAETNLEMM